MKLTVLASGSAGNSLLVESGSTAILVDAGLSGTEIGRRLDAAGCRPEDLAGIVVSHEHGDHCQGVGVLARRHQLPVYITEATLAAASRKMGKLPELRLFEAEVEFQVGELRVRPFAIPHDAADPVAFTLAGDGGKIGIATDMGFSTALAATHLSGCSLLVLESNHDPEMLANGPYPWDLKQRIRGRRGHLSNADAGRLLERVIHDRLAGIVLAHLSETNNRPSLALEAATGVLQKYRLEGRVNLEVAGPGKMVSIASGGRQPL